MAIKGCCTYSDNLEFQRRVLVNKYWHPKPYRGRAKVTGAKAAHLDKLYSYMLRSR